MTRSPILIYKIQFILLITLTILFGCSRNNETDFSNGIKISNDILEKLKDEDFQNISIYYTSDFYNNITENEWIEDLKKLNALFGKMNSYQLTDASFITDNELGNKIISTYEVKYDSLIILHNFTVEIENENYKIKGHNIKIGK